MMNKANLVYQNERPCHQQGKKATKKYTQMYNVPDAEEYQTVYLNLQEIKEITLYMTPALFMLLFYPKQNDNINSVEKHSKRHVCSHFMQSLKKRKTNCFELARECVPHVNLSCLREVFLQKKEAIKSRFASQLLCQS